MSVRRMSRILRQEDVEQLVHLEMGERGVGHRLDVLDPHARGALGLEEARMLDRERSPVGHELQQLDLVLVEGAETQRADVEHAAHLTLDDERDAEHRLDPLLPQDRVEDVRVVDVVEDHRPLLGGDPAREAAADRDADALLHLFLDPERGARDELVRVLVEQEDRARVDLEDLAGALEQRGEELVEPQVCERGVGDRLQPPDMLRSGSLRPHSRRYSRKARKPKRLRGPRRCAAADEHRRGESQPGGDSADPDASDTGSDRPRPGARTARGRRRRPRRARPRSRGASATAGRTSRTAAR